MLETGNAGVYAAIRYDGNEIVLTLVNLTGKPISNYALTLEEETLPNRDLTLTPLLGTADASSITIRGGAFADYKLSGCANQAYIFQLK